ncbi:VWFA domain-containing protein [Actinidia chinensis var. chinensis]|uniref:VWFA domain-containing protein n=1 Tax=Actinidia chinensis var. chinensis TaxID=1590841 RepID=A0A2R6R6Z0_ACTCC|nr:VWFA domain-containing protein [Actinidia chinensis var. chinensis]
MDFLNVAEGRGSPKREFSRLSRARNQRAMIRSNMLEAMAQVRSSGSEDGVVRMKIIVKKQDLNQMLELIRNGNKMDPKSSVSTTPSLCLEQRLNFLRRRHQLRANQVKGSPRSYWRPALQSIPEEP